MAVVVYDANVLYPSTLRDVLIRVGLARLAVPRWTDQILDEVFRNLRKNRPDLDAHRLDRTRALMNRAIPEVLVTGYEAYAESLHLPDPDDRHVLAAALHADARIIVTKNLRDFPAGQLERHGITAVHPDEFLLKIHCDHQEALIQITRDIAATWPVGASITDVLKSLETEAPRTVGALSGAFSPP